MTQAKSLQLYKKILKHPFFVLIFFVFLLANSSSHPTGGGGYTGAPGDGFCTQCHSGNPNFNGGITIDGVPATIMTGETYQITVTVENPNGLASRAGFQILALNASNTNAGAMANASTSSSIKTVGTKKYFGHSPAVSFAGAPLTWTVDWTAPSTGTGNITFYGTSILGNGSGTGGDKMVVTNLSGTLAGGATPVSATLSNISNVTCYNGNDGSATADPTGGSGTYTYAWTNGENTKTAISLPAGLAKVTVTDNTGASTVAQTTITQPNELLVNTINQTNPTCFNSGNGSISVNGSGGTPAYFFDWSNGSSGPSISGLNAGVYIVTITDDNNCQKVQTFNLTAPPPIVINSTTNTNPLCLGQSNGSISLQVSGGSGSLSYDWSNGGSTSTISNLVAGTYTVTITDGNNCQIEQSYALSPGAIVNANTTFTNVTCNNGNNGTATVTPVGSGAFTYLWNNGATTQSINNLTAGNYSVVVTNSNQCTTSKQVTISQPAAIAVSPGVIVNASCLGIPNGSGSVTITGGTGPFTYLWSNGATTSSITNVVAGTYGVSISDATSCITTSSITIGANQSALLSLTNSLSPTCFGGNNGAININSTNAAGFNITWSNGATGTSISNIPAGTYTAIANNPNGCQSNSLEVIVNQPPQIAPVAESISNVLCNNQTNGAITTTFGGGTGTLSYLWSNGSTSSSINSIGAGSYALSVTDANQCQVVKTYALTNPALLIIDSSIINQPICFGGTGNAIIYPSGGIGVIATNWSNGLTGNGIQNIPNGQYISTSQDANGCIVNDTINIISPTAIVDNSTIVNETTNGASNGSIALAASGGTGSLTYLWSNGSTSSSITGLTAGVYGVTIADGNNCIKSFSYNVQSGGCALAVAYTTKNVTCFNGSDGSVDVNVSNGTPPYVTNLPTVNLQAGEYSFIVTDAAGCTFSVANVLITQPSAINIKLDTIINASSATAANGSTKITMSGGIGPYTFQWKNTAGTIVSTQEDPTNLLPDTYSLTVLDANGCVQGSTGIVVGFTSSLSDELSSQIGIYPNPILQGELTLAMPFADAKIELFDTNGKKIISLQQRQNQEKIDVSNLRAGIYLILIDINGQQILKRFVKQ
jgi:hypothetical protein